MLFENSLIIYEKIKIKLLFCINDSKVRKPYNCQGFSISIINKAFDCVL